MVIECMAFVFIDFINDIVSMEMPWASCSTQFKEKNIAVKVNNLLNFLKEKNAAVIHVKLGFKSDYSDLPKNSIMFSKVIEKDIYKINTPGTDFHPDIHVDKSHCVIVKNRVGAFYNTALDRILRKKNIKNIVICGASTNNAVQTCAREAHDRDYVPTILEDLCAAGSYDDHVDTIRLMSKFANIIKYDEFVKSYEIK